MNNNLLHQRWHIDLDWYERNNCSFLILAQLSLCPRCRKRIKRETGATEIFETITTCCSKNADFITKNMPILACVFRIFLSSRNQPLSLEEITVELGRRRSGDASISPETLYRVLMNERYYGFMPVPEEVELK